MQHVISKPSKIKRAAIQHNQDPSQTPVSCHVPVSSSHCSLDQPSLTMTKNLICSKSRMPVSHMVNIFSFSWCELTIAFRTTQLGRQPQMLGPRRVVIFYMKMKSIPQKNIDHPHQKISMMCKCQGSPKAIQREPTMMKQSNNASFSWYMSISAK